LQGTIKKTADMALTQMQVIQSLGEAMTWFQRELDWGVAPAELRHLCGRIGELYVALITNGQMAPDTNQRGYDVVGKDGERISVKTTTMLESGGHISFNPRTLQFVDRVIVLRVNTEEMQVETLLDTDIKQALALMSEPDSGGRRTISLSKLLNSAKPKHDIATATEVIYKDAIIRELESGTIEVERNGQPVSPVKVELRKFALELNLSLLNSNGNPFNTRQLGTMVIKAIEAMQPPHPANQAMQG
jgi:hypothetical protein